MTEKSPVTPIAISVQTKKKCPLELAIAAGDADTLALMWARGTTNAKSPPRRVMMYPDRRSASTSVPYSQTTKVGHRTEVCERSRLYPPDDVIRQVKRKEEGSRAGTRWLT